MTTTTSKPSFKTVQLFNWTKHDTITVEACDYREDKQVGVDVLVTLTQSVGSMRFQYSMLPEQARDMAGALIAAADFLDGAA